MKKKSAKGGINLFQRSYYRKSSSKYMGNSDVWLLKAHEASAEVGKESPPPPKPAARSEEKPFSWMLFLGFLAEHCCPSSLLMLA